MANYKIVGEEREREFLALVSLSQKASNLVTIRDPDRHLDATDGQLPVNGKRFDFAWAYEGVIVELDGGQWAVGGGRHNSDADRWKTLEAQALGWTVVHISYTMVRQDPARVLRLLCDILGA